MVRCVVVSWEAGRTVIVILEVGVAEGGGHGESVDGADMVVS